MQEEEKQTHLNQMMAQLAAITQEVTLLKLIQATPPEEATYEYWETLRMHVPVMLQIMDTYKQMIQVAGQLLDQDALIDHLQAVGPTLEPPQ